MEREGNFLFIGIILGSILGILAFGFIVGWELQFEAEELKTECELIIPRNQSCIMQYIPE